MIYFGNTIELSTTPLWKTMRQRAFTSLGNWHICYNNKSCALWQFFGDYFLVFLHILNVFFEDLLSKLVKMLSPLTSASNSSNLTRSK